MLEWIRENMKPVKVYVNKKDKTYKKLMELLKSENSLLGDNTDFEGNHYYIVDLDASPTIQAQYKES